MLARAESVVRVTDRTWEMMREGAEFAGWPGGVAPRVGQLVYVFDRNLDFTQHTVKRVEGVRVWVGPALPWPERESA